MQMTIFKRVLLFLGVCSFLGNLFLPASSALAQGVALIHLVPDPVLVGAGQNDAVEVRVENVQDLYGLDIRLRFDPSVVEVVDEDPATEGVQVRPGDLLHPDLIVRNVADNAEGTIWFALTQLNPSEAVSGSGTAFVVTFRGKRAGFGSPLSITYQKMASREGAVISASAQDGEVRVVEKERAPPTPTQAPAPSKPTVSLPIETVAPPTVTVPTPSPTTKVQEAASPTAAPQVTALSTLTTAPTQLPPTTMPTSPPAPQPSATPVSVAQATPLAPTAKPVQPTPMPTMKPQTPGAIALNVVLIVAGVALAIVVVAWAMRRRNGLSDG